LTNEEFTKIEREVFDRIRELRGAQPSAISMVSRDARVSVEASVADDIK
jgi:hypothetical protein